MIYVYFTSSLPAVVVPLLHKIRKPSLFLERCSACIFGLWPLWWNAHVQRGFFCVFCNQERKCRVMPLRLSEVNWLMRVSIICLYLGCVVRRKCLRKKIHSAHGAVSILHWKGVEPVFALGMCVDTHYPGHVMAWSPCGPLLTFGANNTHLNVPSGCRLGSLGSIRTKPRQVL